MKENKYIRLALMFGNNNASTFSKNLEKMIALVLHDKYGEYLTTLDIIEELNTEYGLDFSETEILTAINSRHQDRIIRKSNSQDHSLDSFTITPEEKNKIDSKIDNACIRDVIEDFLKENTDIDVAADEFEKVLMKYFYSVFNSNSSQISELIAQGKSTDALAEVEFSDDEKNEINCFLEWNSAAKDKYVYQMVSCCFDYCMMTVKRDKNVYQNIFHNKKFYLDTNIIFRMMGLNQENRKKLIDRFIKKCKEAGITLLYTNQTKQEIATTIETRVKQICDLFHSKEPISVDSVRSFSSKFFNLSFYEAYVKWCNDPANITGDYESFADNLKQQANKVLREFDQIDFDDYQWKNQEEFERNCETLKAYKCSRRGYARDELVKTDVNNYMFIRAQNDKGNTTDFFGIHNYLISADHILGDWARGQRPGSVPIVVLPSVWYSLILQYTGRADDDFAAFTRFLNFSLSSYESENPRKFEILKKVIELDESKEIRERTAYDIEKKLSSDYVDFDSADEIVETSHEYILDQERERISAELNKQADLRFEAYKSESAEKYENSLKEKETDLINERNRHAKEELNWTEDRKELLGRVDDAHKQGGNEMAEKIVEKELPNLFLLYWLGAILIFGIFLLLMILLVIKINNNQLSILPELYSNASPIIDLIIDVVYAVIAWLVFDKLLCRLDKKKIKERLLQKYLK